MRFPQSVASLLLVMIALFGAVSCAPPPSQISTTTAPLADSAQDLSPTSAETADAGDETIGETIDETDIISDLIAQIDDEGDTAVPAPSQDTETAQTPAASDDERSDLTAAAPVEEDDSASESEERAAGIKAPLSADNQSAGDLALDEADSPAPSVTQSPLQKEALDAAFALLASRRLDKDAEIQLSEVKEEGDIRIGMMLPLSGQYAALGQDIAAGAELALFQLKQPHISLVYLDTAAGALAEQATEKARTTQVDIVIGPLFSPAITAAHTALAEANIPALSLTNNSDQARPGNWVLGNLPEQQMDLLLANAIESGSQRFAILTSEDAFASKLRAHSVKRLADFGIEPAALRILSEDVLVDENSLSDTLRAFSRYRAPTDENDVSLPPPPYDSLILAGAPDFLLRVAPVLAYYDLGPDRVEYLGTDLWDRAELRREPSLQGSFVAVASRPDDTAYRQLWARHFEPPPSDLSKLGFDALAVIGSLHSRINDPSDWQKTLVREQGFSGFSGAFRLFPDGLNRRDYTILQIRDYSLQPLAADSAAE